MKECFNRVKNILAICWGMQVAVTAAGGNIKKSKNGKKTTTSKCDMRIAKRNDIAIALLACSSFLSPRKREITAVPPLPTRKPADEIPIITGKVSPITPTPTGPIAIPRKIASTML